MNEQHWDRRALSLPPAPASQGMRGAFQLRLTRLPWGKATRAALTMGACILIGIAMGHLSFGLIICIGAFTSLYIGNEPYRKRAVKMAIIAVGLSLSLSLATLLSGNVWGMALVLGLVSAVATFICGAWSVRPPAAYFFILACAIGTALPLQPSAFALRGGLVLIGGAIAWIINMAAWPLTSYGPETQAVAATYRALADYVAAFGSHMKDTAQYQTQLAMNEAEDAISMIGFGWKIDQSKERLLHLFQMAQSIYLLLIERAAEGTAVSPNLAAFLRSLANTVTEPARAASLKVPVPLSSTEISGRLERELNSVLAAFMQTDDRRNEEIQVFRPTLRAVLQSALRKESLVIPAVLRISIAVVIATLIAAALGNERPYWVPLTTACVLQGVTVLATVHRTVQRAIGTILGLVLGAIILIGHPGPYLLTIVIMALQLVVELLIVRNYGLAVIFITPIPLVLIELGNPMPAHVILSARGIDTILGCLIGVAAGLVLWRRASSVRLQPTLTAAIEAQGDLLAAALATPVDTDWRTTTEWQQVRIATGNLRMVYDRAAGEFSKQGRASHALWPQVIASERLGYLLLAMAQNKTIGRASNPSVDDCRALFTCFGESGQFSPGRASMYLERLQLHPALTNQLSLLIETMAVSRSSVGAF